MADPEEGVPFKSFKDLLRARGEAPAEKPPARERGWSIESADGEPVAEGDVEAVPEERDFEPGARDLITSRPGAFGPMAHGPAVYAELESDEMELLASFRARTIFPADVLAEVRELPGDPRPQDYAGRVDLRDQVIFTIDGEDAQDFDDAIGIRALGDGRFEIGVHIADVAHYVRPETALDAEAMARATSIYLPDQVIPMLPEELSNGLCSLVADRDRFVYSVIMTFDAAGKRVDARVHKSVIKSRKRNTYRVVQDLLDGKHTEETEAIRFLEEPLQLFRRWTVKQQQIRDAKGSLRIQGREKKFVFDEAGEVTAIVDAPRYFSMALIEETALAANQAVGDLFRSRGLPIIYRVHPEKDQEEIDGVVRVLAEHGIRVPEKERLTGRDIGRLILAARKKPNAEALIQRIMGLVERAVYEVHDDEDVARHFGLVREAYLHFTSPIRRYPDLMVHRWLWAIESRGQEAEAELVAADFLRDLNDIAAHCTIQAELAELVATSIGDLKICQYMDPHLGEKLAATIQSVSPAGMVVALDAFNVTAFLPTKLLGERAIVKGPTLTIRAGRRMLSFNEGSPIAVRLKEVDFIRLQLFLELA